MGLFFLTMAVGVNLTLVLVSPEQFVALGAGAPLLEPYRWFFGSVVALAPALFGLLAAAYEAAVGLMVLSGGRRARWGLLGGIVFLVGTTPLGVWTLANPVMALALVALVKAEPGNSPAGRDAVRGTGFRAPATTRRREG